MCISPLIHMNETEIVSTLERLGFTENSYVETILVTRNRDGSYNAAPMGVIRVNNRLEVKPFNSTTTYENLLRGDLTSINVTDDPMLFLQTAFKDELDESPNVKEWRVDGAVAVIMAEKKGEATLSDIRASFTFEPISISMYRNEPSVFSRGRAEAIEAVIHATRVKLFQSEKREAEVKELIEKLDACFDVIKRVSSDDSAEMMVVKSIRALLEIWGVKR
jgi:hypothetical protein